MRVHFMSQNKDCDLRIFRSDKRKDGDKTSHTTGVHSTNMERARLERKKEAGDCRVSKRCTRYVQQVVEAAKRLNIDIQKKMPRRLTRVVVIGMSDTPLLHNNLLPTKSTIYTKGKGRLYFPFSKLTTLFHWSARRVAYQWNIGRLSACQIHQRHHASQ